MTLLPFPAVYAGSGEFLRGPRAWGRGPRGRGERASDNEDSGLNEDYALDFVRSAPAGAFEGAEERDCSIEIPGHLVIQMNGLQLLRAWSLPHFYFHVVTAYDILRHNGVEIGKKDYLSQVAGFIRPKNN